MNSRGFPHSDIPGSKLVCSSPGLIAAYRVLHRLLAPRHSPYALSSLTTSVSNSRDYELCELTATSVRSLLTLRAVRHPDSRGLATNREPPPRRFARQRVRKELPFAGYSVVKDPAGGFRPRAQIHQRSSSLSRRVLALACLSTFALRATVDKSSWLANRSTFAASRLRWTTFAWLANRSSRARWQARAKVGGEYRARTGDLLVANQALSQLS